MPTSINNVTLLGYVGNQPELKEYREKLASFSIATTKSWKKNDEWIEKTEWHSIKAWGRLAEVVEKYINKGSRIYLEGEIQYSKSEIEGITKYFTSIIANKIIMLDKKETFMSDVNTIKQVPKDKAQEEYEESVPF